MSLHEAVRQKDYRLLGRLIRNGANLEEKNEQGDTL